jgi:hypothetical protein
MMIGQPSEYPTELVDGLKELFSSMDHVERAYLIHIWDPQRDEPPHNMIGIFLKRESPIAFPDFAPTVGEVIRRTSKEGEFVDVVDLSTVGELASQIADSTTPFYP